MICESRAKQLRTWVELWDEERSAYTVTILYVRTSTIILVGQCRARFPSAKLPPHRHTRGIEEAGAVGGPNNESVRQISSTAQIASFLQRF